MRICGFCDASPTGQCSPCWRWVLQARTWRPVLAYRVLGGVPQRKNAVERVLCEPFVHNQDLCGLCSQFLPFTITVSQTTAQHVP